MLDLNAFYHLPQLDTLFDEIARDAAGMVIVAGLEPRPQLDAPSALSSGRASIFGILVRQIVAAQPKTRTAVVSETKESSVRLGSRTRFRVKQLSPKPGEDYDEFVKSALQSKYPLVLIEKLNPSWLAPALVAATTGSRIVTQFDAPLRGAWVARSVREACGNDSLLRGLRWVVAVRRMRTLCDECKKRVGEFFRADGCPACEHTGRRGEVTLFDVWRAPDKGDPLAEPSVLSFEQYAQELAKEGYLAADDWKELDAEQLYRTFHLLRASEVYSVDAANSLAAQAGEVELAKRALQQQYRASIALQEVGQKLLELETVQDLAAYICRRARDLCGADRAVFYLLNKDGTAEITVVNGWDTRWLHQRVTLDELFRSNEAGDQPTPFVGYPPGIPTRVADLEGAYVRAGLHVPLVAQREVMGAMIFHSTVRKTFDPRDVALLRSLANAGAAAIQRADLIDNLREKIGELEAAQLEVAKKERLERELELARQVQQNMLPHIFPLLPGVAFYARNEPARQVGGDFYDVFVLDADRVGLVIADVSDKGMPAALFMALTRSLVRAEAQHEPSPYVVLQRVHRLLLDLAEPTQFVTLFYGVLNLTTHALTYVRAGHDYPLLVRGDNAIWLQAGGTILGLLSDNEFRLSEEVMAVEPGDRLVLYTDGLTDAFNAGEQSFGRERLKQVALEQRSAPIEMMGDALFDAVAAHQGEAETFDDMTLLVVDVR